MNKKVYINEETKISTYYDSKNNKLKHIPMMKVGTFNNVSYSEVTFNGMIDNFNLMKQTFGYLPPLKPFHTYSSMYGLPENYDARDILGYISDIYLEDNVLYGDIEVTNKDEFLPYLENKTLRYLSTEIIPNYEFNGEEIGEFLVGASFVGLPAVKGLNFDLIINSEDFERMQNNSIEGGKNMGSLWEQLKNVLSNSEVEEVEEVNEEEVEIEEETTEVEVTEAEINEGENITEKYEEQLLEKNKKIEELEKTMINRDIEDTVDELTREGYLKPANKEAVKNYLEEVYSNEEIRGNFIEILKNNSDVPNKEKKSVEFEDSVRIDDKISEEEAESFADKVMKTK